jgi:exonuclease V gamma subunit
VDNLDNLTRVIGQWVPNSSPEEWKRILNSLLDSFIARDDSIELRLKLGGGTPDQLAQVLSERVVSEWDTKSRHSPLN